jgi:hypothetical protein
MLAKVSTFLGPNGFFTAPNNQPPQPINFTFNRQLTPIFGPFGGSEPITPGTGYNYPVPTYNPGYLYFRISVSGDTSSIAEYGIVSSTFSNPTASSNLQTLSYDWNFQNPSYGLTYSVSSSELRYYKAYAMSYTGDYYYSSGPGVLFQMEEIEFTTVYYSEGGPGLGHLPYDVTIVARLVDPVGTVSEAGFYINQGGIVTEPQFYDPYLFGATGINITTSTASISSNEFSYFINDVGGFDDLTIYVRAYAIYNGQRYWSQLQILTV